jgi:hypothetical protein
MVTQPLIDAERRVSPDQLRPDEDRRVMTKAQLQEAAQMLRQVVARIDQGEVAAPGG